MILSPGNFHNDDAHQSSDTAALSNIDEANSDSIRNENSDSDCSKQSGANRVFLPTPVAVPDALTVEISGACGPFSHVINGVFELTSQQCCGMSVFRKRNDGDKWLEYSSHAQKWNVLDTAHRGQSWGWAAFESKCSIEKCANVLGWKIFDGSKWADCPDMRLSLSRTSALVLEGGDSVSMQQLHGPQESQKQPQQPQKQQQPHNVALLHKRTSSSVMSHRLQHTRFASQILSPASSPKLSPAQPPTLPQVSSLHESTSLTQMHAPSSPTIMKVHHENDAGVVVSHAIKYNQTSTAADVTSYVVRKMQLEPAAYELVFRSLDSVNSDDAVFKCKNDVLLSNAVASCSGSTGKWWVRPYQLSYSEFKIEREWLRKEVDEAVERQKEAIEQTRVAEARLYEVVEHLEDLKAELKQTRLEKELSLSKSKIRTHSIGKMFERIFAHYSQFQVIQ
jgi:hypothetical protein